MGASGLPDLRELAMLGFGEYRPVPGPDQTALANINTGVTTVNNIDLPAGGAGRGQPFVLIGYLRIVAPPDLVVYGFGNAAVPASAMTFAESSREPVLRFLSPEQPRLTLAMAFASNYGNAYLSGGLAVTYDSLIGQLPQLGDLLSFLHGRRAPASMIESAIGALGDELAGFVSPEGSW